MNNGDLTGEETGNAATSNMENENIPEAGEELNDSVQVVDVLNIITRNSEVVDLTTDTETEEDSVASRENLNVALNPVLVSKQTVSSCNALSKHWWGEKVVNLKS